MRVCIEREERLPDSSEHVLAIVGVVVAQLQGDAAVADVGVGKADA